MKVRPVDCLVMLRLRHSDFLIRFRLTRIISLTLCFCLLKGCLIGCDFWLEILQLFL